MKYRAVLLVCALAAGSFGACSSTDSNDGKDGDMQPGGGTGGSGNAGMGSNPSNNSGTGGSSSMKPATTGGGAGMTGSGGTNMPGGGTGGMMMMMGTGGSGSDDPMSADCQGIDFKDIKYSPGGTALPNKCKPFDPTTNNPYAVRCVDAWPWYKTKFPGDEYCILPPPPDKGIQYGVHPQGKAWFDQVSSGDLSGYDNPSDEFIMQDGEEEQYNYETGVDTDQDHNFYRNSARMRPGSHHMIVSADDGTKPQEVWGPASTEGLFGPGLPGAQRPDENVPKSLAQPDEDKGLYSVLAKGAGVIFNMHHFNVSGGPILKEAWTNLWWADEATTRVYGILGLEFAQTATLNVPAGDIQDLHYSFDITEPVRIVTAFGHRHAWTTNFSSWIVKPGGDIDILYQSYNWLDEPTYRYDSMTMNPKPAPEARTDGALSGIRTLMPGEQLHFNCHIEYTNERAAEVNGPTPTGSLGFANEAFTAEMCILFGTTAAVQLPQPVSDTSELPDFAAKR